MMDITKSREDFEDWVAHETGCKIEYIYSEYTNTLYQAWKAARESIEVELPTQDEYDDPLSAYNAINDCKKILRTVGIRIKGDSDES
ncbi:hypothetical protein ACXV6R_004139 [Yersinia enterocolitica]